MREHGGARVFCAFNMTDAARLVTLPEGRWRQDGTAPFDPPLEQGQGQISLAGHQGWFGVDGA